MEHPNAKLLRAMADGLQVMARFLPTGYRAEVFQPIQDCPTSALHSLIRGPHPGMELQGTWEFKIKGESDDN